MNPAFPEIAQAASEVLNISFRWTDATDTNFEAIVRSDTKSETTEQIGLIGTGVFTPASGDNIFIKSNSADKIQRGKESGAEYFEGDLYLDGNPEHYLVKVVNNHVVEWYGFVNYEVRRNVIDSVDKNCADPDTDRSSNLISIMTKGKTANSCEGWLLLNDTSLTTYDTDLSRGSFSTGHPETAMTVFLLQRTDPSLWVAHAKTMAFIQGNKVIDDSIHKSRENLDSEGQQAAVGQSICLARNILRSLNNGLNANDSKLWNIRPVPTGPEKTILGKLTVYTFNPDAAFSIYTDAVLAYDIFVADRFHNSMTEDGKALKRQADEYMKQATDDYIRLKAAADAGQIDPNKIKIPTCGYSTQPYAITTLDELLKALNQTKKTADLVNNLPTKYDATCGCDSAAAGDSALAPLNYAICVSICGISAALGGLACTIIGLLVDPLFSSGRDATCKGSKPPTGTTTGGTTNNTGGGGSTTVTGTAIDLAKKIKASSNITLAGSNSSGDSPRQNIDDTIAGKTTTAGNSNGETKLQEKMLSAIATLGQEFKFTITAMAGGGHGAGSDHYSGRGFDAVVQPWSTANAQKFMDRCTALGARKNGGGTLQVFGPGRPAETAGDHDDHIHCAFE